MTLEESRFERTARPSSLSGHTLILPCVSIGSVPQLAIDALLEPSNSTAIFGQPAQLVSTLDHRFCVPFVGGLQAGRQGETGEERVQGPLRVYSFEQAKVTIVQQRSPIVKSRKADFVQRLTEWICEKSFADVIVLTSLDAGLRTDGQMGQAFWQVSTPASKDSPVLARMQAALPALDPSAPLPAMPSSGLARAYLTAVGSAKRPISVLLAFAAEGDNRSDSLAMAATLLDSLRLPSPTLSQPADWSLLFGGQTNDSMFN